MGSSVSAAGRCDSASRFRQDRTSRACALLKARVTAPPRRGHAGKLAMPSPAAPIIVGSGPTMRWCCGSRARSLRTRPNHSQRQSKRLPVACWNRSRCRAAVRPPSCSPTSSAGRRLPISDRAERRGLATQRAPAPPRGRPAGASCYSRKRLLPPARPAMSQRRAASVASPAR